MLTPTPQTVILLSTLGNYSQVFHNFTVTEQETFNVQGTTMPEVIVKKGEPIDRALKRLKSKLETEGIMDEVRRLRAFETPVQKTKRKAKANAKRAKAKFRFNLS
jgi:small subunit ribosomal protein S21